MLTEVDVVLYRTTAHIWLVCVVGSVQIRVLQEQVVVVGERHLVSSNLGSGERLRAQVCVVKITVDGDNDWLVLSRSSGRECSKCEVFQHLLT